MKMQTQNRLLDDLARVATGTLGVAAGMRGEIEARLREQFEKILARMDVVPREEFEVVKAMAVKAREEQEILAERLVGIEARLGVKKTGKRPAKKAPGATRGGKPARK